MEFRIWLIVIVVFSIAVASVISAFNIGEVFFRLGALDCIKFAMGIFSIAFIPVLCVIYLKLIDVKK